MFAHGALRRSIAQAVMTACLGMAALSAFASDDEGEFTGYLRAGAGTSSHGGTQNCYYLGNGNGHGYRLGNECDSYTEFGYSRTMAKADDGVKLVGYIMVNDYSGDSAYSGKLGISQIFVQAKGLDWLNGGTAWVGERYYERPDIHWMDLQYINLNGTGGGFDNIGTDLGGKFSYAIFKDNDTNNIAGTSLNNYSFKSSNSAIRNNFLYRGLPVNAGGTLDLAVSLITPSSPDNGGASRHSGYSLHLFHNQDVMGGGNTFGVQYGVGAGTGRGDPGTYTVATPWTAFGSNGPCCNRMGVSGSTLLGSDDTRLRIFDALWIQPTKDFGAGFNYIHQEDKSPVYGINGASSGTSKWDSFGIRPSYAINEHFKLQGQIGIDRLSYPGTDTENLTTFTIAPTISLGKGFFDRPELRFFVTHAKWNNAATANINANNANSVGALGMATSGTSFGVQVEAWWGKNWF
ncbi:carbohydrate porin [Burkholderiaceae bacterium DAT-1]|nr:carbohydrate porin [Burkholderiaceae bacterium DAT-1]